MRLKVSSVKRRPFCLGLNVLNNGVQKHRIADKIHLAHNMFQYFHIPKALAKIMAL